MFCLPENGWVCSALQAAKTGEWGGWTMHDGCKPSKGQSRPLNSENHNCITYKPKNIIKFLWNGKKKKKIYFISLVTATIWLILSKKTTSQKEETLEKPLKLTSMSPSPFPSGKEETEGSSPGQWARRKTWFEDMIDMYHSPNRHSKIIHLSHLALMPGLPSWLLKWIFHRMEPDNLGLSVPGSSISHCKQWAGILSFTINLPRVWPLSPKTLNLATLTKIKLPELKFRPWSVTTPEKTPEQRCSQSSSPTSCTNHKKTQTGWN